MRSKRGHSNCWGLRHSRLSRRDLRKINVDTAMALLSPRGFDINRLYSWFLFSERKRAGTLPCLEMTQAGGTELSPRRGGNNTLLLLNDPPNMSIAAALCLKPGKTGSAINPNKRKFKKKKRKRNGARTVSLLWSSEIYRIKKNTKRNLIYWITDPEPRTFGSKETSQLIRDKMYKLAWTS